MSPSEEQKLEEMLKHLPEFSMRKSAEFRFYGKLFKYHLSSLSSNPLFSMKKTFATVAALLIIAVLGGTAFSLQPSVTNGHFFYPLKRAEERVELLFIKNPLARVRTHLKFADRRLEEVQILVSGRPEASLVNVAYAQEVSTEPAPVSTVEPSAVEATVQDMVVSTEAAMQTTETLTNPADAQAALTEISQTQEEQVQALTTLSETAPAETKPALQEAVITTQINQSEIAIVQVEVEQAVEAGVTTVTVKLRVSIERDEDEEEEFEDLEDLQEDAEEEIAEAKEEIEEMKKELAEAGVSAEELEKLLNKVAEKLAAAEAALAEGNFGKARGLAKATQALTNNAKGLMEKNEEEDDEEDEEDEKEEDEDEEDEEDALEKAAKEAKKALREENKEVSEETEEALEEAAEKAKEALERARERSPDEDDDEENEEGDEEESRGRSENAPPTSP